MDRRPRRAGAPLAVALLLEVAGCGAPGDERAGAAPDPGYAFTEDWFSRHVPVWDRVLEPLRGRAQLRYLEVGVYEGRSFFWVLDHLLSHPSSRATAIDTFPAPVVEQRFRENLEKSGRAGDVTVLKGFSQVELRKLPLDSFDLIYLDGSHLAEHVLADAVLSWDLLELGGLLIFDDYYWTGLGTDPEERLPHELLPKLAIDAFVSTYANHIEVVDRGYQLILRKRLNPCAGRPACTPIGAYLYQWREGKLYDRASGQPVALAPAERALLERLGRSRRFGRTDFTLDPALRSDPAFLELWQRLDLDLRPEPGPRPGRASRSAGAPVPPPPLSPPGEGGERME